MVNLAKFLGIYEEYKAKLKNYGIKWTTEDTAFNGFLSIFSKQHDTLPQYIKEIRPLLTSDERLFLKFLAVSGLRKNEALTSFNMIIKLNSEGKLCEYYNEELSVLEHFKYKIFLRKTKNAYISFVSKALIDEICNSQPVTYNAIHCRFARRKMKLRLKELRSYHNSYLRKNGVISELVDILAGRVPKTVFCRHYLGESMKEFSKQILNINENLEQSFLAPKMEIATA
jgi:intergrase/recombinase